jgi:hypothetical protein
MPPYISILKTKTHDTRQLIRYIEFIKNCLSANQNKENLVSHHICPEANEMFPEYGSFKDYPWNKALLTDRQHYIAHMMLWKVYRNKSMTFAFNMMSNFQRYHYSSRLYEEHRQDFRKFISEINSRPRTDSEKLLTSEMTKNSLVVYDTRDPNKTKFRIKKDDENYDPKFHLFYRTGYKHSEDTKMKIGRMGKKYCHNPNTGEIKAVYENDKPANFVWGYPEGVLNAEHVKNTIWCHNPDTKEHIRVPETDIPEGYIKGRFMKVNLGLDKANSMINVVDLKNKKVDKVFEIDRSIHGPESGASTKKTVVFTFGNKIFTSKKKLVDFLGTMDYYLELGKGFDCDTIMQIKVKKPHYNCKEEVNEFRMKYQGKTNKELGVLAYPLEIFDFNQHQEKEIYWDE